MVEFELDPSITVASGEMKRVMVGDRFPIVLCGLDRGEIVAYIDACPHAGVRISAGSLYSEVITCPAHGAKFCAKTGCVESPPAEEGLRAVKIERWDGAIIVTIPDEVIDSYVP